VNRRWIFLSFLYLVILGCVFSKPTLSDQTDWTEEKIGKLAVKADQAARRNKWARAIKYGEQMLSGSAILFEQHEEDYITRLKTLNRYYDKRGRLLEVSDRVKKAYFLSKKHLNRTHDASKISRLLYYKLLIAEKDYERAIDLVVENISLLEAGGDEEFRKLHYLGQLFSLYGLTKQYSLEEKTLEEMLALNKRLMGDSLKDNIEIIMNLGKNYCLQNKIKDYTDLMKEYALKFICPFQ